MLWRNSRSIDSLPISRLICVFGVGLDSQGIILFPLDAFDRLQRGLRLHHDLGINWQGVSVALGLLERIEELEQQVHYLSNQPGE